MNVRASNLDSLISISDIVIKANITQVSGGVVDDAGTVAYRVTLKTYATYFRRFPLDTANHTITWVVTASNCKDPYLPDCISKYQGSTWLLFLKQDHFYNGDYLPDFRIVPFNDSIEKQLIATVHHQKRTINHFYNTKTCEPTCKLCYNIKYQHWDKVERIIRRETKHHSLNFDGHRRIIPIRLNNSA